MPASTIGMRRNGESIAVIGAGPGGLATAAMLAAQGLKVTVYEREALIGGRTSQVRAGDYRFDRGPTFFLMPYVLEEIFSACGRSLADYVTLNRLDPMYRLVIGNRDRPHDPWVVDATQDLAEMCRRLSAIDPADGAAFERFISDNRAKLDAAEPILRRPIRSLLDLVRGDAMKAAPHIKPHMSVHGLLSKYFSHPAVRLAVSFQSKYLGMSPYECPSLFTILPFIEYEYGIWHPTGGCHALMRGLGTLIEEMGGTIETSAEVTGLEFAGERLQALVVNGERREHDNAVINADASWALKNLVPERLRGRQWSDDALSRKRYSCSTAMLYLGVEGSVDLPHHTIYMSREYEQNLEDISRRGGAGGSIDGPITRDPSFYVCNPSPIDPTLAPEGDSSLYVLLPTPNTRSGIDWEGQMPRLRSALFSQMKDVLGLDLESRVKAEVALHPGDWQGMGIAHGATFNLAHSLDQMLHKRPPHKLPGAKGVWLVGGGTHPGSGLPVIFLSAQITSRLLCEELGMGDPTLPATPASASDTEQLQPV
ncbi:MAG: phytoene desaturase family protein [Planctomycetota bacterium]